MDAERVARARFVLLRVEIFDIGVLAHDVRVCEPCRDDERKACYHAQEEEQHAKSGCDVLREREEGIDGGVGGVEEGERERVSEDDQGNSDRYLPSEAAHEAVVVEYVCRRSERFHLRERGWLVGRKISLYKII